MHLGTMLNAYPDSLGKDLGELVQFLSGPDLKDAFRSLYLLPTAFNTDLDRGFSVISYDLCPSLVRREDLNALRGMQIDLTLDLILNHLSVLSPQFQDLLKKGEQSAYRDFFIDWNRFWEGEGEMGGDGVVVPDPGCFIRAHLRKPGLPVLRVRFPDGKDIPYWNTFYQKIIYPELTVFDVLELTDHFYDRACELTERVNQQLRQGCAPADMDLGPFESCRGPVVQLLESRRHYLGQMDVNVQSPLVWEWYDQTLKKLAHYGAKLIRLDAFTRLHKASGRENFMNEPETWEILQRLKSMAAAEQMEVLPEIHATYASGAFRKLHGMGCAVYDYFLPALILDAIETGDAQYLAAWAGELIRGSIRTVHMLGCHDGIPIRDLQGLLPEDRLLALTSLLVSRGGRKKMILGTRPEVYQMDMTYYSALGCDDSKLELARAIQLFMPGKPQIWYMDLLAGKSDEEVFARDPGADSREMNRKSYSLAEAGERLSLPVVQNQLKLLRLRNTHPAFGEGASVDVQMPGRETLILTWTCSGAFARMRADLSEGRYAIECSPYGF